MCSSFESITNPDILKRYFALSVVPENNLHAKDKRPTDETLAIVATDEVRLFKWGFTTDWSAQPLINARSETLLQKATFQKNKENRCLIPAQAWYEWRKTEQGKLKNHINIQDVPAFAMAAIFDEHRMCILTCAPHPQIAHIHNRMPLLIAPPNYATWLDKTYHTRQLTHLMQTPQNIAFNINEEIKNDDQLRLI